MNLCGLIDLRSDTVTRPGADMRAAMAAAEVGDDVYGEDPTVNRLQARAADLLGKEAALFVPSGTMGNQIAIKMHTRPGQEVITEAASHIHNYEMAAMAAISGVMPRPVPTEEGIMAWDQIEACIRPKIYYVSQTGLIALENTHNMAGGTVYAEEQTAAICERAHAAAIPVHLDGARIFNAAVALGVDAACLCAPCDSVMFCLSKGLGAPVGSLLVGSRDFIEGARSVRKMFGGGMRQVGVLAAAGLIALEKMRDRLAEDHEHARLLAGMLSRIETLDLDPGRIRTNIVVVGIRRTGFKASQLVPRLREKGVLVGTVNETTLRLLTHVDVCRSDMERAARVFAEVLSRSDS